MGAWQIPLEAAHGPAGTPGPGQAILMGQQAQSQLQNDAQRRALEQQQQQGLQLQNQQSALDLNDQKLGRQAMLDAAAASADDPSKMPELFASKAAAAGASPKYVFGLQKSMADAQAAIQTRTKEQLANDQTRHDQAVGLITAYMGQAPELKADPNNWAAFQQKMAATLPPAEAQQYIQTHTAYPGDDTMKTDAAGLTLGSVLAKRAIDQQEADAKKAEAAAATQNAATKAAEFSAQKGGLEADSAQKQKAELAARLAAAPDAATYAQILNSAPHGLVAAGGFPSPEQWTPATPAAVRQIGLTSEQQQQAAQNTATEAESKRHNLADEATARWRAATDAGHLKIAQQTYEQTYGAGANPALVGVEPRLRTAAAAAAMKADKDYNQAVSSTDAMQAMLDQAKNGNKVAYAYAPVEGVLTLNTAQGIKRVNINEIKAYGGAGSSWDKLQGWLTGHATGATIPPDILKDMGAVNKMQRATADAKYSGDIDAVNKNYHSNFQAAKPQQQTQQQQGGGQAAAMPAQLSASDVGKVYKSRTGQLMKITAVNPKDPTQFKFDPVNQ